MKYFLISALAYSLVFVSCKHNEGPTNDYKNAKVHPSDREAKSRKKLTKKAEKQARKQLKKARKKHGVPT
jgi:hypothetical protein